MKKALTIGKRVLGAIYLPLIMYLAMMWLCFANGKTFYGTWTMWRSLIASVAISATCAYGIGLQFKCGRFDFSGGAIMLLAAIIAGNVAKGADSNPWLMAALCIGVCVVLSLLVALVYIYGRMPVIIVTIGMALLYESLTCLIYNGGGINLVANTKLKVFSSFPMALLPLVAAIIIYWVYGSLTTTGRRAALLAGNQQAAVNIGIDERKNVLVSYIFSGLIFGFAAMIYASTGLHKGAFNSLATVGELFTNILPVFIGLIISKYCGDTLGILLGSLTLCLLSFGLTAVMSNEIGAALTTLITGVFILLFNVAAGQGKNLGRLLASMRRTFKTVKAE